jgi:hypothetical protein
MRAAAQRNGPRLQFVAPTSQIMHIPVPMTSPDSRQTNRRVDRIMLLVRRVVESAGFPHFQSTFLESNALCDN